MIDKATKSLAVIQKNMADITKVVKAAETGVKKFNVNLMGLGLSMTFFMFGVQMQLRAMLRRMFTVFEEAHTQNGKLITSFNIIRANLGAISIAFFDAFEQSGLFSFVIGLVEQIANWFINLTDNQREWMTSGVIGSVVLIQVLQTIGQVLLAVYLLVQLGIAAWGPWALIAVGAVLLVWTVWKAFKEGFEKMNDEIKINNEIVWVDWKLKALSNILSVTKFIANFPRRIQSKLFGGIIETSVIENLLTGAQSKLLKLKTPKKEKKTKNKN